MSYQIKVTRSGGFLGYAESVLKVEGKIFETENEEEAKREAKKYNEEMNTPYSSASFYAEVIEIY